MRPPQRGFTLIELLIVVAIIGIIAAIAIPSLIRARVSANEAGMIGDSRTVISAQIAYHAANQEYYGLLICLSTPATAGCIPGYTGPTFLDAQIGSVPNVKTGYQRSANYAGVGPKANDVDAFCYQGRATTQDRTGVRSFGADGSQVVSNFLGSLDCCVAGSVIPACVPIR